MTELQDASASTESPAIIEGFSFDDCDIFLRTSDNVFFGVHRWPLAHYSSVFKDMLSFEENDASETHNGKPLICLAEDSPTLGAYLRLVYYHRPQSNDLASIDKLDALFCVIDKYDSPSLKKRLNESNDVDWNLVIKKEPIKALVMMRKYDLSVDLVRKAFVAVIQCSLSDFEPFLLDGQISSFEFFRVIKTKDSLRKNAQRQWKNMMDRRPLPIDLYCSAHNSGCYSCRNYQEKISLVQQSISDNPLLESALELTSAKGLHSNGITRLERGAWDEYYHGLEEFEKEVVSQIE